MVSTTLPELETAAGIAVTGTGTLMPMPDLIRLAEHAHHYLVIYRHHTAEPLYLGRTKRLASKAQRLLLHHRDRGCTRPGCTRCANHCQAHHAQPSWARGGHTDAPTLGLGCGPDNRLAELGWTTTIDPTTGRVHWHPPPLLDTGGDTNNGVRASIWVTPLPTASANSIPIPPSRCAIVNAGNADAARPTRTARAAAPGDIPQQPEQIRAGG
ncbi:DUF222 domain-containing protein [Mycolicibacterium neoaurum]|uniref:DUF222 domain-containing protein n=1 Tax=Mycolicibacterium neoaurum TaxID=1795 RepID=UPI0032B29A58